MKDIYDESNEYRINVEVSSIDEVQEVVKKIEDIRNEYDVFIKANIDVINGLNTCKYKEHKDINKSKRGGNRYLLYI